MTGAEVIERAPRGDADHAAAFTWDAARAELDGLPGGRGLNVAHEAVTRHAAGPRAAHVALRVRGGDGPRDVTYAELEDVTSRFASLLRERGIARGERVCTLLGKVPEVHLAALGALKAGAVFCPLLASLGPEPIRARLAASGARVLVTSERLYRRNVEALRRDLPALRDVLLVGAGPEPPGTVRLDPALARASPRFEIPPTDPEEPAFLHFTSGTTAGQKGVVHAHAAVVAQAATARRVLDLRPDDVFWCPAAPGWIVATAYGIVGALACGATVLLDEADVEPERCYERIARERVSVWYTTPTTLRVLRNAGADVAWSWDVSSLRLIATVGEPLDAELLHWAADVLGQPVLDDWWQTETGCIAIANLAGEPVKPGSMGRPAPGMRAAVVRRGARVEEVSGPDAHGELALAAPWPSMFRGYLGDATRYRASFAGGWYLTGDLVRRDADGHYWFLGRGDDVIKSAGQIVGPFEVECALLEHPAVSEVAVIGKPDPIAHERVKAFVVPKPGFEPGDDLVREILAWSRTRLGDAVAPREVELLTTLPRTASGKLLRRVLRARELGVAAPPDADTEDDV